MLDPLIWLTRQAIDWVARSESPWPVLFGLGGLIAASHLASAVGSCSRASYRRLTRFHGYRKLLAVVASAGVAILAHLIGTVWNAGRPLSPVSLLVWMTAWMSWWHVLVLPVRGIGTHGRKIERTLQTTGNLVIAAIIATYFSIAVHQGQLWLPDETTFLWQTGVPLGLASWLFFSPDLWEWLKSQPTVRRHFLTGHGHNAGLAGPRSIAKKTTSLPSKAPSPAGYTSEAFYMGRTLFEDSYLGGRDVWEPVGHLVTISSTGGGKAINTVYPVGCTFKGSAFIVSPKPELADVLAGRRTDISLFGNDNHPFAHPGVDVRGHTKCRYHLPGGRVMILDPHQQGYYPSCKHTILSEIDPRLDIARALVFAVATGAVPENPESREPFFIGASRSWCATGIGHVITRYPKHCHTFPFAADRIFGVDPETGRADPALAHKFLVDCAENGEMGGFIRAGAVQILELGETTRGSVLAELSNHLRFLNDPLMRRHLEGPSSFSYSEVGADDNFPLTVFVIPPRMAAQESMPFLRIHTELFLALQIHKRNRPRIPTWVCLDEYRQYPMEVISSGVTILREAQIRLHLIAQGISTLSKAMGKHGVGELLSCSALQCYGIKETDLETLEFLSKALGKYTVRHNSRFPDRAASEATYDVMTPAELAVLLHKTSPLQLLFSSNSAPMKLERLAHKALVTKEGARFRGLPLDGHFDEGLSQFSIGKRPT